MIETTISCTRRIKTIIEDIALKQGKSKSHIILLFIKRVMKERKLYINHTRTVRYQGKNSVKGRRMHVRMSLKEYECCLDMRKFCKSSVSLLVAFAVEHYQHEIEEEINRDGDIKTDNYPVKNYYILKNEHNGVILWQIYWGKPAEMDKKDPSIIIQH